MLQFKRLRLAGFKSFVESTELLIETGTTGIVGPNGCGKSNLVEALRWVMGESSAKRMRGGEMDDVIFAGTQTRPARNLAEVSLLLDNSAREAAAVFNDSEELQVVRRIERGQGSHYRVNGRESRARDVQLLFADAASGAQSGALVSQGKIGQLVNARPVERRALLEEAAGITGLYSRRHESELRLKAAESNLERLEDVVAALEQQLSGLKKQVRQASRYRNLQDRIRRFQAIALHLESELRNRQLGQTQEALRSLQVQVGAGTQAVAEATRTEAAAAEALPPLREAEAVSAAKLQKLTLDRETLAQDRARLDAARKAAGERLQQIERDRGRAQGQVLDAGNALATLTREAETLEAARPDRQAEQGRLQAGLAESDALVAEGEESLQRLTQALAHDEAGRRAAEERRRELTRRQERLAREAEQAGREVESLRREQASQGSPGELEAAVTRGQSEVAAQSQALEAMAAAQQSARGRLDGERRALAERERELERLAGEAAGLAAVIAPEEGVAGPPLLDRVRVAKGYEVALGAALGDDLSAPEAAAGDAEAAAIHWSALSDLAAEAFPEGVVALSEEVEGPPVLRRRLSRIGLVADVGQGETLQGRLKPGQRLVSKAGDLWRWDGFVARADAPSAAAQRLAQRNRLAELEAQVGERRPQVQAAREALAELERKAQSAAAAEQAARQALGAAQRTLEADRTRQAKLARALAASESRLAALAEAETRRKAELAELQATLGEVEAGLAALPDLAAAREGVATARTSLASQRSEAAARRSALDRLVREAEAAQARAKALVAESKSWQERREAAQRHEAELGQRAEATQAELDDLAQQPDAIAERQARLAELIVVAERERRDSGDRLAAAETALAEARRQLKQAEAALAEAREAKVRAEAAVEAAQEAQAGLIRRVRETLDCPPYAILVTAGLDPEESFPPAEEVEEKLQRLLRERDAMGPVNLRAEIEAGELETQIADLLRERDDLTQAIARLRQGIAGLNKEGRARLLEAFAQVDKHFSALFQRLFGGGRAHLSLTGSEDPLEAGLEIMASPPGKRLQVLSLLSGGEQALTALALLFAVFRANPAPICVLDEVDAPLDDANVDRFCALVQEMAAETETRFLVITHHRVTMSRVDRLYGVTMGERGISQLVSVDLQQAETLRETA
ncbi:MAG: chromosome segregation protein SMC [Rhodospirillales bacterium]